MLGRSGSRIPMSQIFLFIMLTVHETPALSRGWNSNQVNSITELLILIFYWAPSAQQVLLRVYMGVSLKLLSLGLFFSLFFPLSLLEGMHVLNILQKWSKFITGLNQNTGTPPETKADGTNVEQMCLVSTPCLELISGRAKI